MNVKDIDIILGELKYVINSNKDGFDNTNLNEFDIRRLELAVEAIEWLLTTEYPTAKLNQMEYYQKRNV